MSTQRFARFLSLMAVIAAVILQTGCVTNGRRILLKEYGPSIQPVAGAGLSGTTIWLKGFTCASNLVALQLTSKPEEPAAYTYTERTREQDKLWDREQRAMQKQTAPATDTRIGNMRDGFGIVMSHVYAMNDPGAWLAEGLKYDLEAQGAKVVDASQADSAELSVSGTIQLCRLDMYMTVDCQFAIDLEVQPKNGIARRRQIHTHGMTSRCAGFRG
jgi:hypothetical protein